MKNQVFLRRFRDPIRVPRISNQVLRITKNYHRVPKIRENWVPKIREIGSSQIQTGFLTFSFKKKPGKTQVILYCTWLKPKSSFCCKSVPQLWILFAKAERQYAKQNLILKESFSRNKPTHQMCYPYKWDVSK